MKKIFTIHYSLFILLLLVTACNPNYDMPGMFNGSSERADKRLAESLDALPASVPNTSNFLLALSISV